MTAGYKKPGLFTNNPLDHQFMSRVDGTGVAGYRKGFDPILGDHPADHTFYLCFIYGADFPARDFKLSRNHGFRFIWDFIRIQTAIRRHNDHPDFLALTLNDGIGCQGGGQRHQLDISQHFLI